MSNFVDRVQNLGVLSVLATVESQMEGAAPLTSQAQPPERHITEFDRLRQVVALVRRTFDGLDPNLAPVGTLNSVHSALQNLSSSIGSYIGNPPHLGYLEQANTHADELLAVLPPLRTLQTAADVQGVSEAIRALRESISQSVRIGTDEIERLRTSTLQLQSHVDLQATELTNQKGRLDQAISDFQQQFSTAQESRNNEFTRTQASRNTDFASTQDARQQSATALLNEQRERFDTLLNGLRGDMERLNEEALEARKETERALTLRAESLIAAIGVHRADAEKVAGIIGQTGMVAGYQRVANEERDAAKFWNRVALEGFVGLIICALFVFLPTLTSGFQWAPFAGRVFVSMTFGALATYAATQASQHQQNERRSRQMELEIASLGPFLAPLKEDQQHEMLRKLADRLFGQPAAAPPTTNKIVLPANILTDAFKAVLSDAFKK